MHFSWYRGYNRVCLIAPCCLFSAFLRDDSPPASEAGDDAASGFCFFLRETWIFIFIFIFDRSLPKAFLLAFPPAWLGGRSSCRTSVFRSAVICKRTSLRSLSAFSRLVQNWIDFGPFLSSEQKKRRTILHRRLFLIEGKIENGSQEPHLPQLPKPLAWTYFQHFKEDLRFNSTTQRKCV